MRKCTAVLTDAAVPPFANATGGTLAAFRGAVS